MLTKLHCQIFIKDGQTELSVQIGDYTFKTKDGTTYQVYDKTENLVNTVTSNSQEQIDEEVDKSNEFKLTETNGPLYVIGYETKHQNGEIEKHNYIIVENKDGSIVIISNEKLTEEEKQKVIDYLININKITKDTIVNEATLPNIKDGQTELSVQIGDYTFKTKDGKTYQVYDKTENLVNTITKAEDTGKVQNDAQENSDNKEETKTSSNQNDIIIDNQTNYSLQSNQDTLPNVGNNNNKIALFTLKIAAILIGSGLVINKKNKYLACNNSTDYELFAQNWISSEQRKKWQSQRKAKTLIKK